MTKGKHVEGKPIGREVACSIFRPTAESTEVSGQDGCVAVTGGEALVGLTLINDIGICGSLTFAESPGRETRSVFVVTASAKP